MIGKHAFNHCSSLKKISIPSCVETIDYEAFTACSSLISVTLNEELKRIGQRAFYGCSSLQGVSVPSPLELIESIAFCMWSSLVDIDLKEGLKIIGWKQLFCVLLELEKVERPLLC